MMKPRSGGQRERERNGRNVRELEAVRAWLESHVESSRKRIWRLSQEGGKRARAREKWRRSDGFFQNKFQQWTCDTRETHSSLRKEIQRQAMPGASPL